MQERLTPIISLDQLDRIVALSTERPVLLFKHSHRCGTSVEAYDQLLEHLSDLPADHVTYAVVTVQTHRDVSNAVAARLSVRHETPQALLIRDGRVVWIASHFRVTALAIAAAVSTVLATRPAKSRRWPRR